MSWNSPQWVWLLFPKHDTSFYAFVFSVLFFQSPIYALGLSSRVPFPLYLPCGHFFPMFQAGVNCATVHLSCLSLCSRGRDCWAMRP